MNQETRGRWKGPLMWFFWGALMGFGLLGIFSIGIPLLLVGLALLFLLVNSGQSGAWIALVGAATPWMVFAAEAYVSPDCAKGISTISPSGERLFRCKLMNSPTELMPFLIVSVVAMIVGLTFFALSLRRRDRYRVPGHGSEHPES